MYFRRLIIYFVGRRRACRATILSRVGRRRACRANHVMTVGVHPKHYHLAVTSS